MAGEGTAPGGDRAGPARDADPPSPLAARARLVGRAAALGAALGGAGVVALLFVDDALFASRKSFAVGAVLLGFGLLGWSGSVMAGEAFEAMHDHLDISAGWTERKSRRAMARVGGLGGGWMVGASLVAAVLR